jgi:hypothetical protein
VRLRSCVLELFLLLTLFIKTVIVLPLNPPKPAGSSNLSKSFGAENPENNL